MSKSRKTNIVSYRHTCIYMLREFTSLKLVEIAKMFDLHHSSIILSVRSMDNHIETEADTRIRINHLRKRIKHFIKDFADSKEFDNDFTFIDMNDLKVVELSPNKYILSVGLSSNELSSYFKDKQKITKYSNTGLFLLESKPQYNDNQTTNIEKENQKGESQDKVE